MQKPEWFVDWFNSPYYHLLYRHRNHEEATEFMQRLYHLLKLREGMKVWDLACGRGRHALSLHALGLHVIGTDLSVNSITEASRQATPSLEFFVHDMRQPFKVNYFDAVFNLFTSIGYFENEEDNFQVFSHVALSLIPGGYFVVDFMNAERVVRDLVPQASEQREDIRFNILKQVHGNKIVKRIEFQDKGHEYYYEEKVSLLKKKHFEKFANAAGLRLENVFGNYRLDKFSEADSERLILVFKK